MRVANVTWTSDPVLRLAKMVIYFIVFKQGIRGCAPACKAFNEIFPNISDRAFGKGLGHDLEGLRQYVEHTQGLVFSNNALYQRADKANRYHEILPKELELVQRLMEKCVPTARLFTDEQWQIALATHGEKCIYCDAPFNAITKGQADHYWPHSRGGPTEQYNCVPACVRCNEGKSNSLPHEWVATLHILNGRGRN